MRAIALFFFMIVSLALLAQNPKVTWGEEFKMKRGSTGLEVILADEEGVYIQEYHTMAKGIVVVGYGNPYRISGTLVKLDKSLNEIYREDYNQELKGKDFEEFFVFGEKLYLLATEYDKKEKSTIVHAAEVNKRTGKIGEWKKLTSFDQEKKNDEVGLRFNLNSDSTRMVVIGSVESKGKQEYSVQEFDKELKPTTQRAFILNEFEPKTFELEDVIYTNNKKIILVGREFAYAEGKKKREKFREFTNYNIRLYNEKGLQEKVINTSINSKWLMNTKIFMEKDHEIVLCGFYSNAKKGKTINGMLIQRLTQDGEVIATSEKVINESLMTGGEDGEDKEETKEERKEREKMEKMRKEGEEFSEHMKFRKLFHTSDGGLLILSENYNSYITYVTQSTGNSSRLIPVRVVHSGEILASKVNASGEVEWVQVIPKRQQEATNAQAFTGGFVAPYFDKESSAMYGGFGVVQTGSKLQIIFNDHAKNANVYKPGQKAKIIRTFGKSDCFLITLDQATGAVTKTKFLNNSDQPVAMPRLGVIWGNVMYLIGKDERKIGKPKLAVARIQFTN